MKKTILEQFNEESKIIDKNEFKIIKLNIYEDNSFEVTNELIDYLKIPKHNQNAIKFIFYELTGNIYDHSKFSEGYISGRLHNDKYDFIVVDNGISIKNS